jgi:uncharacterized protein YoxC
MVTGPGGVATIIAACSLLVIAIAISYAVIRVGRFIDEAKNSLKTMTDEAAPLIHESTRTVELINSPLESFAKNVEDVTTKVADATTGFMDKSGPAVKVAGAIISAAGMKKAKAKKKKKAE